MLARPRSPESLPVTFDRRRVYILPTGFGGFFLLLMVVMAVGALNYNNNPALMLCLLLAGAANASLLAAHLQLSGLTVQAITADPVAAGQSLRLRVHLAAADGRERIGLHVEGNGGHGVVSLDAAGTGEAVLLLPARVRGWLHPKRVRVSTTQPLGLARAWSYVWPQAPLLVYPTPEAAGPPIPDAGGETAQARVHPAGDDLHHLRPYRTGDARRAIAWKASARRDSLVVREHERPVGAEVALDWDATAALPHEARISRLARWVDEAERDGRRYRLALPGQRPLGPDGGAAHRHACLRALALLPGAAGDAHARRG